MMFYLDERHFENKYFNKAKFRQEDKRERLSVYYLEIYDILCQIEYNIINKKIDLDAIDEAITPIKVFQMPDYKMPHCILIKLTQIQCLTSQFNHPILDDCIQKYKNKKKQQKPIQNTESYEITKAHIFDEQKAYLSISLSPNEKYLLVRRKTQVYLYDITTKLNIKKYQLETVDGFFSSNSRQIILPICWNERKIVIIDIITNKKQQYRTKYDIKGCFISQNYFYYCYRNWTSESNMFIKIDLKSNRQISKYDNLQFQSVSVQVLEGLMALVQGDILKIINEPTRKSLMDINLSNYGISKIELLINKNEILTKVQNRKLIVWNIDYQNNRLIKNKELPFEQCDIYRSNLSFGYFYIYKGRELEIVDEKFNSIYKGPKGQKGPKYGLPYGYQSNSDRTFIISQKDGIYILKRHEKEKAYLIT